MLSIIIGEHNEDPLFLKKMINQVSLLPYKKELIFATSSKFSDFYSTFGRMDNYKFPVSVIGGADSCGAGRNAGGFMASGDTLLYMDAHCCFTPSAVDRLLKTLNEHPDSIVAPALQPVEFPSCVPAGGLAHGVAFEFSKDGGVFQWRWLPADRTDKEFPVPFVCGCAFSMKKSTFDVLNGIGGFLVGHQGLSWEEEVSMRLARMGNLSYSEPRAIFGHMFKGYENRPKWDTHSVSGYYKTRVAGFYVNVFDKDLWNQIEPMLIKAWGDEYYKNLEWAKTNFGWLRAQMKPYANRIDERYFLRVK